MKVARAIGSRADGVRPARQPVAARAVAGRRGAGARAGARGGGHGGGGAGARLRGGACCRVGEAELALGHHEAAAAAYEQAESQARAIGQGVQHDATAGRARVALAADDVAGAMGFVEALLAHRADGGTFGGADSRRILFTCHQVLARAGDPRAAELLASAHAELQARAATITDAALRQSFLSNVPHHREIVAAWAAPGRAVEAPPRCRLLALVARTAFGRAFGGVTRQLWVDCRSCRFRSPCLKPAVRGGRPSS